VLYTVDFQLSKLALCIHIDVFGLFNNTYYTFGKQYTLALGSTTFLYYNIASTVFSRRSRLRGWAVDCVPKAEPDRWRPHPHSPAFLPFAHRCPLGIRESRKTWIPRMSKRRRIELSLHIGLLIGIFYYIFYGGINHSVTSDTHIGKKMYLRNDKI